MVRVREQHHQTDDGTVAIERWLTVQAACNLLGTSKNVNFYARSVVSKKGSTAPKSGVYTQPMRL